MGQKYVYVLLTAEHKDNAFDVKIKGVYEYPYLAEMACNEMKKRPDFDKTFYAAVIKRPLI